MSGDEFVLNSALLAICYMYVLIIIFVAGQLHRVPILAKYSRKFLHMMIGNLVFIIPFFTFNLFPMNFPFFVAVPFILVTFLASPYSPLSISQKMKGLANITERGHQTGLMFYALSYTVLAALFSSKPYFIAIGILPMSYGDAFASIIGEKYGKKHYLFFAKKSLAGSLAMFSTSFLFVLGSLAFMSVIYPFSIYNILFVAIGVGVVATLAEAFSPLGFDNISVPSLSVLTAIAILGGF
jgi:phytol kinase